MKTWIIKDWANNHLFRDKEFKTFEAGWSFLYSKFPNETCWDDYYVEVK